MNYTTTAAQFFADTVPGIVSSSSLTLPAPAVFQITGSGGGVWSIGVFAFFRLIFSGRICPETTTSSSFPSA